MILARDARKAVVIRRGPSKCVCTMEWDRDTDQFTMGQWMRGMIRERFSDLSPDGKHFIYSAYRPQSRKAEELTVISVAPYLKAIGLWAGNAFIDGKLIGFSTGGGGVFVSNTAYAMHRIYFFGPPYEEFQPIDLREVEDSYSPYHTGDIGGLGSYPIRLQWGGWTRGDATEEDRHHRLTFSRDIGCNWVLEKIVHVNWRPGSPRSKGSIYETHRLIHRATRVIHDRPLWEWADLDRDRLVWAEGGSLWAGRVTPYEVADVRLLHDFNGMRFKAIRAPY
ncbi:MAG: hypothetical protein KF712_18070 [Akkermansiaceae bacterium]|nr:hypothetical protein [Akkermansiaceae bacterium]